MQLQLQLMQYYDDESLSYRKPLNVIDRLCSLKYLTTLRNVRSFYDQTANFNLFSTYMLSAELKMIKQFVDY